MIATTQKAKTKRCPFWNGIKRSEFDNGMCCATECFAWKFWIDPSGKVTENPKHGIKDSDKKGYCGLTEKG